MLASSSLINYLWKRVPKISAVSSQPPGSFAFKSVHQDGAIYWGLVVTAANNVEVNKTKPLELM